MSRAAHCVFYGLIMGRIPQPMCLLWFRISAWLHPEPMCRVRGSTTTDTAFGGPSVAEVAGFAKVRESLETEPCASGYGTLR